MAEAVVSERAREILDSVDAGIGEAYETARAIFETPGAVCYIRWSPQGGAVGQKRALEMALTGDVLDRAAMTAVREQVLAAYGRVDILVNNAGFGYLHDGSVDSIDLYTVPRHAFTSLPRS